MKFLKLLDPYLTQEGSKLSVADQQQAARLEFPGLVASSHLNYRAPDSEFPTKGNYLLIGLAASFSLRDLRLADLLNDALAENPSRAIVEVFNLDDVCNQNELMGYFGSSVEFMAPPIVGLWIDGTLRRIEQAGAGVKLALRTIGISDDPSQVIGRLDPPGPELLE